MDGKQANETINDNAEMSPKESGYMKNALEYEHDMPLFGNM